MKTRVLSLLTVISLMLLLTSVLKLFAQQTGTNGGRVIMSVGLTPEQATRIREETKDLPEMSDLQAKLVAAQRDAIAYAIKGSPTDEGLKGKLDAVAQIQSQIALLRFKHGIKAVLPTVSDAQKEQMLQTASFSYNQLFVGSTSQVGQVGLGAPKLLFEQR